MKLVIDIDTDEYEQIKGYYDALPIGSTVDIAKYCIANGKSFSTVLAEMKVKIIAKGRVEDTSNNQFYNFALNDVLDIINEYTSGKE